MNYKKSDYLQVVKYNDKFFVYHSLFNNPTLLDSSIINFINLFETPKSVQEVIEDLDGDVIDVLSELTELHFIIEEGTDERKILSNKQKQFIQDVSSGKELVRLELAISNSCNFGCKHCMHFLNNDLGSLSNHEMNMSIENAKASIDAFVDIIRKNGNNRVRLHFGNGEPLINWGTIQFVLEYCESINDINFSYAINTNLSLLNTAKALILKKYDVKISTSVDGFGKVNDLIRTYRNGNGTFHKIVEKIKLLDKIGFPIDGFSVTVTDKNFPYIDSTIVDWGKKIGIKDISMDFDLVNTTNIPVEKCVEKIISMRNYAKSKGINFYGTWETPFRILTSNSWVHSPHSFCPAFEGKTIEFNVDKSIKVCGHTNTRVGHINSLTEMFNIQSEYTKLIRSRLPGNNEFCIGCELEGSCSGQCHVTREASLKNPELIKNMCNFMRQSTKKLIMEYLVGL